MQYRFEREARTPYSEVYIIEDGDGEDLGRIDLHYSAAGVYATLCVGDRIDESDVQELIGQIDERLVLNVDPYREDFVVTVWRGQEVGVYSDEEEEEDEESDEDYDADHNGHVH